MLPVTLKSLGKEWLQGLKINVIILTNVGFEKNNRGEFQAEMS